jgi:hypothetical protein
MAHLVLVFLVGQMLAERMLIVERLRVIQDSLSCCPAIQTFNRDQDRGNFDREEVSMVSIGYGMKNPRLAGTMS